MKKGRIFLIVILVLSGLCLLGGLVSWVSNRSIPQSSANPSALSVEQKALLAEAVRLRAELGSQVWPGWSEDEIPLLVFNEAHAFLVGLPEPADGWVRVPRTEQEGGPWQVVLGDDFLGDAYYSQALASQDSNPQNFTVLVGDRWVAALQTREYGLIRFASGFREELPPLVRDVFPYSLAWRFLFGTGENYVGALLHEAFHAYQGMLAPERLAAAEQAISEEGSYPWEADTQQESWDTEMDFLVQAARAEDDGEASRLAGEFLAQRARRRAAGPLTAGQVDFERQREWLEGLAKYAELTSIRSAGLEEGYTPYPAMSAAADFNDYSGSPRFYDQQLQEATRMSPQEGETRFYYSGFTQAVLLDRLLPGWKERAFDEGVWLEDLLAEAVRG